MHSRFALAFAAALAASPALAQDSAKDGSGALAAGSQAVTLLGASGVKTAVGVSAVPTSVAAAGVSAVGVGASGVATASGAVADSASAGGAGLSEAADQSAKAALKVDEEVVVAPDPAPKVPYQAKTR